MHACHQSWDGHVCSTRGSRACSLQQDHVGGYTGGNVSSSGATLQSRWLGLLHVRACAHMQACKHAAAAARLPLRAAAAHHTRHWNTMQYTYYDDKGAQYDTAACKLFFVQPLLGHWPEPRAQDLDEIKAIREGHPPPLI